jgi:hypothetical protein
MEEDSKLMIKRMYHKDRVKELEKKYEDIKNKEVYLSNSEIKINNTTILGNKNKITGVNNLIIGKYNTIKGNTNTIEGSNNYCEGNKCCISGRNNIVIGNKNRMFGEDSKAIGKNNSVETLIKLNKETNKKEKINFKQHTNTTMYVDMEIPKEEKEQVNDENIPDELLCIVCLERRINTVILDCRHAKLCIKCSRTILLGYNKKKCPVCREEIKRGIIKIF